LTILSYNRHCNDLLWVIILPLIIKMLKDQ
jgi:hypothetical protein